MQKITMIKQNETENGWKLVVAVDGTKFDVEVDKTYWREMTGGAEDVEKLVGRSFAFLLERESKESILRSFNLRDIEKYFPEYPETIKQ